MANKKYILCIDDSTRPNQIGFNVTKGKIYVAKKTTDEYYDLEDDVGNVASYFKDRFIVIEKEQFKTVKLLFGK